MDFSKNVECDAVLTTAIRAETATEMLNCLDDLDNIVRLADGYVEFPLERKKGVLYLYGYLDRHRETPLWAVQLVKEVQVKEYERIPLHKVDKRVKWSENLTTNQMVKAVRTWLR